MDSGKISITITTAQPVKIRVTPEGGNDGEAEAKKEAEGMNKLLNAVKGGGGHVVHKRETRKRN